MPVGQESGGRGVVIPSRALLHIGEDSYADPILLVRESSISTHSPDQQRVLSVRFLKEIARAILYTMLEDQGRGAAEVGGRTKSNERTEFHVQVCACGTAL